MSKLNHIRGMLELMDAKLRSLALGKLTFGQAHDVNDLAVSVSNLKSMLPPPTPVAGTNNLGGLPPGVTMDVQPDGSVVYGYSTPWGAPVPITQSLAGLLGAAAAGPGISSTYGGINRSPGAQQQAANSSNTQKGMAAARQQNHQSLYQMLMSVSQQPPGAFQFGFGLGPATDDDVVNEDRRAASRAQFAAQVRRISDAPAVRVEHPRVTANAEIKRPAPDYMQTLTGWRAWFVKNQLLESVGVSGLWLPHLAQPARCVMGHHHSKLGPAPQFTCTCGYWSFKSMDLLMSAFDRYRDSGETIVLGSVEIWGRVIECENGYRSEFAYPKELWLMSPATEYLSWTYGVPIRRLNLPQESTPINGQS